MAEKLENILSAVQNTPRLLIKAELSPVQGDRFQPTGFPDLGAATYKAPRRNEDGSVYYVPMLLVESAQSMANRLEGVCWDKAKDGIIEPLRGLPHVVVNFDNGVSTSSIQEPHRLSSYYLLEATDLKKAISEKFSGAFKGALDVRKLAQAIFDLDVGSVLHGVFVAKKEIYEGRARLQRLLSSFIEAEGYEVAASGGAKIDRLDPKGTASESGTKGSEEGRGNIIYSRTEFTAKQIVAYFNLDLATMRGYGLGDNANRLLIALSLFKILKLLEEGLRLRTACDLELKAIKVTRPQRVSLEGLTSSDLADALPGFIKACGFGDESVTHLKGKMPAKKKAKESENNKGGDENIEGGEE